MAPVPRLELEDELDADEPPCEKLDEEEAAFAEDARDEALDVVRDALEDLLDPGEAVADALEAEVPDPPPDVEAAAPVAAALSDVSVPLNV